MTNTTEKDFTSMSDEQFKEEMVDLLKERISGESFLSDDEIVQKLKERAEKVLGEDSVSLTVYTYRENGFARMGNAITFNPNTDKFVSITF